MPAAVVCSVCQTKLKVPENPAVKALRCPKCKAAVPLTSAVTKTDAQKLTAAPTAKPDMPPPAAAAEEEFEVNEAADAEQEEFEFNEEADEEEEIEVNEAIDEEEEDEDSSLRELGFANVKDPYKKASIPDDVRQAIEQSFVKNEKARWAGRPSVKLIESKAWIGLVVGPLCVLVGVSACLGTSLLSFFVIDQAVAKIGAVAFGGLFGLVFSGVGVLAVIFRKGIGGNVKACYVVTNKRAYIHDGRAVRAFTPRQIANMRCEEATKFEEAGDLIFAYDLQGNEGLQLDQETKDKYGGRAVGFLNIEKVRTVQKMLFEVLIDPALEKDKQRKKEKRKLRRRW